MARKRYSPEQIFGYLRKVEISVTNVLTDAHRAQVFGSPEL